MNFNENQLLKNSSNKVLLSRTYVSAKCRKNFLNADLFRLQIYSTIEFSSLLNECCIFAVLNLADNINFDDPLQVFRLLAMFSSSR